jgi:hypothetical protein
MNATNQIMSILQEMGAKPETIPGAAGETLIRVNAPTVETVTTLFDSDLEEYENANDRR